MWAECEPKTSLLKTAKLAEMRAEFCIFESNAPGLKANFYEPYVDMPTRYPPPPPPRVSHIMPALNLDFEKKKKALKSIIEHFSSIICTFANRNSWKTDKSLNLAKRLQLFAVKSHFQLKFCALSLSGCGRSLLTVGEN